MPSASPARWTVIALLLTGCDRTGDPYRVQVDVGPQIRAFAEDTLTADDAGTQLVQLGPAVIPALAAALEGEPKDVRVKAIEVLATIGSPDALPALMRAVERDPDDDVRGDALRALGIIGDPRGRALVEAMLDNERLPVRSGGVTACAKLCASPDAIDRLAELAIHDPNVSVALAARTSLHAIGERDGTTVRRAVDARRPEALPVGATADERALAALLASDVDGGAGTVALVTVLPAASPALQRQIAWRLGAIGDEGAVDALGALHTSPDRDVRLYAVDALRRLRERGVDAASKALSSDDAARPAGPLPPPEL
ncbi:MAG TPA: HEAT repeat domain-containing protein [Candidatus Binatia bacterium]|nr:HEAT repeat domain-containing protein [Candidatus Binatia bacterium]